MQRIQFTIQGREKDRIAISLTLSLYGARLTQCPLHTYYTDPDAYARGQLAICHSCPTDILFGPFALPLEGRVFGSEILYFEKSPPNLKKPVFSTSEDIQKLKLPDMDSHPVLQYMFQAIRKMKENHGDEMPIAAIALTPVDLPVMLFGIHSWLEVLLFFRKEAEQLIKMLIPYSIEKMNRLFESGASFLVIPCAFTNPTIVTREIIEETTLPVLKEVFQEIQGPLVLHSSGAPIMPFLDLFSELRNVIGFVLNADEDIREARRRTGPGKILIGNIDGPSLGRLSREEVFQERQKVLMEFGEDPGFILGTSGADIAYDTPVENIQAFQ